MFSGSFLKYFMKSKEVVVSVKVFIKAITIVK